MFRFVLTLIMVVPLSLGACKSEGDSSPQARGTVAFKDLKDGDRVKLGLQSELLIQVVEVPEENITVEQYLNKECDRLVSKLQSRTDELVGNMKSVLA